LESQKQIIQNFFCFIYQSTEEYSLSAEQVERKLQKVAKNGKKKLVTKKISFVKFNLIINRSKRAWFTEKIILCLKILS
jgi:hypothetical protein